MKFKFVTREVFENKYTIEAETREEAENIFYDGDFFPDVNDWKEEEILFVEELD